MSRRSDMKSVINKYQWVIPTIIMAIGSLLRIWHLFSIPFNTPFHLGGLFYEFSHQIILNNFAMPATIPYYSLGGIPFAYPPLAFYIQAILIKVFSPPLFATVNLLPPLITLVSLPTFYWMIKAITDDDRLRIAALAAYALMPSAFINQIEAAGLAEAFGTVAILFFLGWLFRFKIDPRLTSSIGFGVAFGLCVVSSPGSAYGAIIIFIIFSINCLTQDLVKRRALFLPRLFLSGMIGLLTAMPYWLTLINNHVFGYLLAAFGTQQDASALLNQIKYMVLFKPADMITFISDEGIYGFLFDWLAFAGLLWALLNKQKFQVLIFFAFWFIPREGCWLVAIPAAWLAALGIIYILWPLLKNAFAYSGAQRMPPLAPGLLTVTLLLLAMASGMNAQQTLQKQVDLQIAPEVVDALRLHQELIPTNARVLIAGNPALREWAPALLRREILNCEFGLEWQPIELDQVTQINTALNEKDLSSALTLARSYSGTGSIWLIGDSDTMTKLLARKSSTSDFTVVKQTNELVYAVFNSTRFKTTIWSDIQ